MSYTEKIFREMISLHDSSKEKSKFYSYELYKSLAFIALNQRERALLIFQVIDAICPKLRCKAGWSMTQISLSRVTQEPTSRNIAAEDDHE